MRDLGFNDSQIVLRMAVSTSKAFIASLSDKGDHNFDLPQIAEISKYFHQHDQKDILLDHIFTANDIHVLLEFLNMFPMQGEESFYDIFNEYSSKPFEERKEVVIDSVSTLIISQSETIGNHVYIILNSLCNSRYEVYSVFEETNSKIEKISSLSILYETLTPERFIKLFDNKSKPSLPSNGLIQTKAWLSRIVAELVHPELNSTQDKSFALLNTCLTCEEIYSVIKDANPIQSDDISSNLNWLHSILSIPLHIRLFSAKSEPKCPSNGTIKNKTWLNRIIVSLMSEPQCERNSLFDFLNACLTCDEICHVVKDVNTKQTNDVVSNLIWLHSLLSDDLLVKLFSGKCDESAPFEGNIEEQPWLIRLLETQIASLVSATFKLESFIAVIQDEDEGTRGISKSIINLLLDKTDNYRMIRREFFQILTCHYKDSRDSAIEYVKKYSSHTSSVAKIAVEEIKGQYDFTTVEKLSFLLSLLFTFFLSSAFHCLDVGADYSLLIRSGNCANMNASNVSIKNDTPCNNTRPCEPTNGMEFNDTKFCQSTVGTVSNYWEYTLIACVLPFILNAIALGIETFRNTTESILALPINMAKLYWLETHSKSFYAFLTFSMLLWVPFVIVFYPIATKLAFVLLEYNIFVNGRALNITLKNDSELYNKNNKLKKYHTTIINELVKSSTLEVVTEATFQPLIQLYSLFASNSSIYKTFDPENLLDNSITTNAQVFSILTSIVSFCWSMTAYHAYMKRGALDLGIGLKARLLLFASISFYIIARLCVLVIAGNEILGDFDNLTWFLIIHLLLMSCIHIIDLQILKVPTNYLSLDVWMEIVINGFASTLMPNKIKFCRFHDGKSNTSQNESNPNSETNHNGNKFHPESDMINERYHEKTSFRYLTMDTLFFIENVSLVFLCWQNWNDKNTWFTSLFPLWTIGLFSLALVCRFLYYQQHTWPIKWDEPILFIKNRFFSESKTEVIVPDGSAKEKDGNLNLH